MTSKQAHLESVRALFKDGTIDMLADIKKICSEELNKKLKKLELIQ